MRNSQGPTQRPAFPWLAILVVLLVLGGLLAVLIPAFYRFILPGQMCTSLSRCRQMQIATQMMTLDSEKVAEGMEWTSRKTKTGKRLATLEEYFQALVEGHYLNDRELRVMLSTPGRGPGDAAINADNIGFRFFSVNAGSPADQALMVTANWREGSLTDEKPYGKRGFVAFAKGGSGGIYQPQDAANPNVIVNGPGYSRTTLR